MTMTKLLSVPQICGTLGISEQTLKGMIDRGEFPQPLKIGLKKRVWLAIDLDAFIRRVEALRQAQLISGAEAKPEPSEMVS